MTYIEAVTTGHRNYEQGVSVFTQALLEDLGTKGFIKTEQVEQATAYLGTAIASCLTDVSPNRNDANYRFRWRIEDMPDGLDGVILRLASKYPFLDVNYLGNNEFNCSVFNYEGDTFIENKLTQLIGVIDNCSTTLFEEVEKLAQGTGLSAACREDIKRVLGLCGFCKMFSITSTSVFKYEKGSFNKKELKLLRKVEGIEVEEVQDGDKTYLTVRLETAEK